MSRMPDFIEFSGIASGFLGACLLNILSKKRAYSGFHKHIIFTAVGYGVAHAMSRALTEIRRRRALHVEDYINAHPEHFDEIFKPEKKWADMFIKWHPNR